MGNMGFTYKDLKNAVRKLKKYGARREDGKFRFRLPLPDGRMIDYFDDPETVYMDIVKRWEEYEKTGD